MKETSVLLSREALTPILCSYHICIDISQWDFSSSHIKTKFGHTVLNAKGAAFRARARAQARIFNRTWHIGSFSIVESEDRSR
jgi:hypothetical protein